MSEYYGVSTPEGQTYAKSKDLLLPSDCFSVDGNYSGTVEDQSRILTYVQGGVTGWGGNSRFFEVSNYAGLLLDRQIAGAGWKYYV